MKLVLVEFIDTRFSLEGWQLRHSLSNVDISPSVAVGILIDEDKDKIVLALALTPDTAGQCMAIPKVCITRMRRLKTVKGSELCDSSIEPRV